MNLFNQYSYPLISLLILAVVFVVLRRFFRLRGRYILAAEMGLAGLLLGGWLVLRPGESDIHNVETAEAMIGNGRPTFVEFFSNYCAGCLAVRPVVDGIVTGISDNYNVMRIDIHTDLGRELRRRYGFSFTPEFVVFDSLGSEVWRAHQPPSGEQLQSVMSQAK